MAQIDKQKIKKLNRGELAGTAFTVLCGVALVYFIVGFSLGTALKIPALKLSTLIAAPVITALSAGAAAFCNIKYGGELDKIIRDYVRGIFIENAALMHPERDSLTFFISFEGRTAEITVNNYNDKIIFDFSDFGKLSLMRRSFAGTAITETLSRTFIKLITERGLKFKNVGYTAATGRKKGRLVFIIRNGEPEKRAMKNYLKNR